MSEEKESITQAHLALNNPSIDSGAGSINAEHIEIDIREPRHDSRLNTTRFTPEQVQELRNKVRKQDTGRYFALKDGHFEKAAQDSKGSLYYDEVDGHFVGAWLLTEIDHWDNEKERLVMITQKQLIVVQYNFITMKIEEHHKIPLVNCHRIQASNLGYTNSTFGFYRYSSQRSNQHGVRVHCNVTKVPGMFDIWNPWSKDIPYITLMSHTSTEVNDASPEFVDFGTFQKSLIAAASSDVSRVLATDEEPILMSVVFGISAMIHNQSKLGFCRDRGGVCY